MKVKIKPSNLFTLMEAKDEITYFSFFTHIKNFIKDLLQKPIDASASEELKEYFGCDDKHIIEKLVDADIIRRKNKIIETPKEVTADNKSKVRYSVQYVVPRENFKEKIHGLFQKEILKENAENEYLDKYYGKPLKNYLKMDDDATRENLLYYKSNFTQFADFLEYKGYSKHFDDEELEEIRERCEQYDETLVDDILNGCYREYANAFANYVNDSYPPTSEVMAYVDDINSQWLVHFSDNASEIWKEGFVYATDDIDRLGYTDAGSTKGKSNEGWCFAYTVNNIKHYGFHNYGSEAVMFIASGVKARHFGDEEYQVVFWNNSAHDIVYLQHDNEHGWFVGDLYKFNSPFYQNTDIVKVIEWVQKNLPQYRKWLINPNEHKNYQTNNKKSIYTTNMVQESLLHKIIRESMDKVLKEDGATTCGSVMQGGGSNPSAGQYDVPAFGNDKEGQKRSHDFKNDSMMMQRLSEEWDDMNKKSNLQYRPIYQTRTKANNAKKN